jgi:archaemetzincin
MAVKRQIGLTPVGRVEESLLNALVPFLVGAFEATVTATEAISLPEAAFNPARRQYQSTVLLDALAQEKHARWERQLGVTDVDLYVPDLNFVFGEADARRGIAVFSIARLYATDRDRFLHRAATEAIHELAHTYGLTHCSSRTCVMWFSNTLEETDRKGTSFCPAHDDALKRAIGRADRARA